MLAPFVLRLFCSHKESVLKVDANQKRIYTECIHCLHKSPGIPTGVALSMPGGEVANG